MEQTVTVNDVMSQLEIDEIDQEKNQLNVVSPHFSSEKNDTARETTKGCLRKPAAPLKMYRKMRTTHFQDERLKNDQEIS